MLKKLLIVSSLLAISIANANGVEYDFDGDGKADIAVRRPSTSYQYIINSSGDNTNSEREDGIQRVLLGQQPTDIPISGDFDGDGVWDIGVRRPSTYQWIIRYSSTGETNTFVFGRNSEDIPVPADYDGDGKTDLAVRRPSNQYWYIKNSSGSNFNSDKADGIQRIRFGARATDIPVPADYDGDGKADIAVRRPSNYTWYIKNSSGSNFNSERGDGIQRIEFGRNTSDIPVPADYTGDGKADIAVRRPSNYTWYIKNSDGSNYNSDKEDGIQRIVFGKNATDIPVVADYDGDGVADVAVRRTSNFTWYVRNSTDKNFNSPQGDGIQRVRFGQRVEDIAIAMSINAKLVEIAAIQGAIDKENFYSNNIETQLVENQCLACHSESGTAATSRLVFTESSTENYDVWRNFFQQSGVNIAYVMQKLTGNLPHGDNITLDIDEQTLLDFMQFVAQENGAQLPEVSLGEDLSVNELTTVNLSVDIENAIEYEWSQTNGIALETNFENENYTAFATPEVISDSSTSLRLWVTDSNHLKNFDDITLNILDVPDTGNLNIEHDFTPEVTCHAISPNAGEISPSPSKKGGWTRTWGDEKNTRRSELVGNVSCPKEQWRIDLGARRTWLAVTNTEATETIEITPSMSKWFGDYYQLSNSYQVEGVMVDLDGNGNNNAPLSDHNTNLIGDFLPELPGYERITCDTNETGMSFSGPNYPCFLQNRSDGQWNLVWQTEPLRAFSGGTSSGNAIVGDFDADNELEVAVIGWYEMHVLDLKTGAVEAAGAFLTEEEENSSITTPRAYGWLGARNIDDDPELEFVIMGDFEKFISVMDWNEGNLVEIWDRQIEAGIRVNKKRHDIGVENVADIDGDGTAEVIASIFNETGDGKWHLLVLDATTGVVKFDLEDRHLAAIHDLNNDAKPELFVTQTNNAGFPKTGPIEILSFVDNQLNPIWRKENAGFPWVDEPKLADLSNGGTIHNRRRGFVRDNLLDEDVVFATYARVTNGEEQIAFYTFKDGAVSLIGTIDGVGLSIENASLDEPELGILVKSISTRADKTGLRATGVNAEIVQEGRAMSGDGHKVAFKNILTSSVVTNSTSGRPLLVTQDFRHITRAYGFADNVPSELWQTSGRGMTYSKSTRPIDSNNGISSALIANRGDAQSIITVSETTSGFAEYKATSEDGELLWKWQTPVPGELPVWNEAGATHWTSGNFTNNEYEDILVGYRNSVMTSDEMVLLDGLSGKEIWRSDFGGHQSGCTPEASNKVGMGAVHMPNLDWDNDGKDEFIGTNNGSFSVLDGDNGNILLDRWTTTWCQSEKQLFTQDILSYSATIVEDFNKDGQEQILFTKNEATLAMLDANGDVQWNTPFFQGLSAHTLPGIGYFNNQQRKDILTVGTCNGEDDVTLYNSATGEKIWSLALPAACEWPETNTPASADLDGDGLDEAVIVIHDKVYGVGQSSEGTGEILWEIHLRDGSGENSYPIIADVNGDGKPSIIINTSRGYVIGFGE